MGMKYWRNVAKWCAAQHWKKGRLAHLAEAQVMEARLKLAVEMGVATRDQLLKAKELMDAKTVVESQKKSKDGSITMIRKEVPDYRTQNEGLKRAMELTGTKVETMDVQHRHSGEIIHKYQLPERGAMKKPDSELADFKEVKQVVGDSS
jgi:hypothetical protein